MFKTFYDDLTYMPRRKFNAKYTVPALLVCLGCVLLGQLLTELVPLSSLDKVSGRIIGMDTRITSWSHERYSTHDTPNYALFITLDNDRYYEIRADDARAKLGAALKYGDSVTIYYPTSTVKVLSAGLADGISQIERGTQVLYSWKEQQTFSWYIIGTLAAVIAFFYWLMTYMRDCAEVPKML